MKKILLAITLVFVLLAGTAVYAQNNTSNNTANNASSNSTDEQLNSGARGQIQETKENAKKELEDYQELYGSDAYGFAAYILSLVRFYSIPICFVGVAISAIYQNVIGAHRLDVRDKGHYMLIGLITLFLIAQALPLIFAIVIKGFNSTAF